MHRALRQPGQPSLQDGAKGETEVQGWKGQAGGQVCQGSEAPPGGHIFAERDLQKTWPAGDRSRGLGTWNLVRKTVPACQRQLLHSIQGDQARSGHVDLQISLSSSLLDIVLRRKEMELIFEKTCGWFRIDCKPNFYVEPKPVKHIQEFTYDEDKLKMMGVTGSPQRKSKKSLSPEEKELHDAVMGEIGRSIQELIDSRKYSQGDQDDGMELTDHGKLIQEPEFLMDDEQYHKYQEKRAKRMQEYL